MSEACCTIPPVTSDYQPKGDYTEIEGLKAYVTGDPKSSKVLVAVYDIFGYYPQTQQGADALASLGFRVVMPDLLQGKHWSLSKFPPSTDEDKKEFGEYFSSGAAHVPSAVKNVEKIAAHLAAQGASVGVYGFCWGGKVVTLVGSSSKTVKAISSIHPAFLEPRDFEDVNVPVGLFPSGDEEESAANKSWEVLQSKPTGPKSSFKYYKSQIHGFAAARADLAEASNKEAFSDLYGRLGGFFNGAL